MSIIAREYDPDQPRSDVSPVCSCCGRIQVWSDPAHPPRRPQDLTSYDIAICPECGHEVYRLRRLTATVLHQQTTTSAEPS